MLPINFPFPPCPYCSIHMTSLWLSVLQEAFLNMHTHNKVTNRSSQTQSFTSKKCLPQSQILGSEPKGLSRGVCWEKWGLGQFSFFALLQTLMNVPMRRCAGAMASVRTQMAPSAASVTVAMRPHLLGTTALVSLPGSLCQSVKESHWLVSLLCDGSQTTDCTHTLRNTHMDRAAHGVKTPSLITADLWDCKG